MEVLNILFKRLTQRAAENDEDEEHSTMVVTKKRCQRVRQNTKADF